MSADLLPLTWRWAIAVPQVRSQDPQETLAAIQRALSAEGAIATTRDSTRVDFRCFWALDYTPKVSIEVLYPFLFLFGGNVVISLWRFPGFLRRTLAPLSTT